MNFDPEENLQESIPTRRNTSAVLKGGLISATLLILFLAIFGFCPSIFELPTRWVAIAMFPAIVGLIIGGFINGFRGFGIEVDVPEWAARLEDEVVASQVREIGKNVEEQTEGASIMPEGTKNTVLWASDRKRRQSAIIEYLREAGYTVEEMLPDAARTTSLLSSPNLIAVVTNLIHADKDYSGGLKLIHDIKKSNPKVKSVIFTNKAALKRRQKHLEEIDADANVSNEAQLMLILNKLTHEES